MLEVFGRSKMMCWSASSGDVATNCCAVVIFIIGLTPAWPSSLSGPLTLSGPLSLFGLNTPCTENKVQYKVQMYPYLIEQWPNVTFLCNTGYILSYILAWSYWFIYIVSHYRSSVSVHPKAVEENVMNLCMSTCYIFPCLKSLKHIMFVMTNFVISATILQFSYTTSF